jgi:hypothetical protein
MLVIMRQIPVFLLLLSISTSGALSQTSGNNADAHAGATKKSEKRIFLNITHHDTVIQVLRKQSREMVLTHISKPDNRAYIHPIMAPDGKGTFTEYRPSHHLHQTGLYWGLKRVNERDFFMGWNENYYRKVSSGVIRGKGQEVKWQAVYDLLDENKNVVLTETHNWTLQDFGDRYYLDLEWSGEAKTDITFGQFYVGGLFLRMPWVRGVSGQVTNAMGQINVKEAEAQRAIWADVGVQIEGRDNFGHMAILDHPTNSNFPTAWRVDSQLGLGPSKQITGDWKLDKGKREVFRYRVIVYTGDLYPDYLKKEWIRFVKETN